jgi:Zn-finger nucleic acid-binding protein
MKCPNCNATLVMSERQGIEIDYCPECRGVWLDRGELDKIIERSVIVKDQPEYNPHINLNDNNNYKNHDYYKHKKRGFLGELFD